MADIPERAIDAALSAYIDYQRKARHAVWTSPARDQVRRMLEAAAPFLAAAEREGEKEPQP